MLLETDEVALRSELDSIALQAKEEVCALGDSDDDEAQTEIRRQQRLTGLLGRWLVVWSELVALRLSEGQDGMADVRVPSVFRPYLSGQASRHIGRQRATVSEERAIRAFIDGHGVA